MSYVDTYLLVAFDIATDKEVIRSTVAATHYFAKGDFPAANWQVVGVRQNSTSRVWEVDVQKRVAVPAHRDGR